MHFYIYEKGLPVYLTKKDRPVVKYIARNFDGVNLLFISNRYEFTNIFQKYLSN